MYYCEKCKVEVATPARVCPLCQGPLMRMDTPLEGPAVQEVFPWVPYPGFRARLIQRISWGVLLLLTLLLAGDLIFRAHPLWVVTGLLFCIYLGVSLLYTVKSRQSPGSALLRTLLTVWLVAVVLDYSTGFAMWSTTYVLPFTVITASFTITTVLLIKPQWFRDYFVYQLVLLALALLPLLLSIIGMTSERWPGNLAAVYALVSCGQMFSYYGWSAGLELRKRLHL